MDWIYISLGFVLISSVGSAIDGCNYHYKYSYDYEGNDEKFPSKSNNNNTSCDVENISDNWKYTLMLSEDGSWVTVIYASGILKVKPVLPNINCNYRVALLVNDSIKSEDECRLHDFENESNRELHSIEQNICVSECDEQENKTGTECQKDDVYFEHVYTGCYALRFTIDGFNYVVRSKKFIKTNYQRADVEEPLYSCHFDNRKDINESRALVTFRVFISILYGTSSINLQLMPLSSEHEKEKNACIKYSKKSTHNWNISLNGLSPEYCNYMKVHANGTFTEDLDCNFALPVSYNDSYCLLIELLDGRCLRDTVWNPAPHDGSFVPCSWMPQCERVAKTTRAIEYNGDLQETNVMTADPGLLLPIAVGIIILILVLSASVLSVYRLRLRRNIQQSYLNANLRDLKVMTSVEGDVDTDEDNEKVKDDSRAIVLMYARGPKSFMGFMSDFREILKLYCSCHVYDWYAACEWDSVATIGACDWATQLFKKNYRTVWIDTPAARSLAVTQMTMNNSADSEQGSVNVISDFRDIAFPATLDYAKRSILNAKLQYSRHFIVRLEGYNANSTDDPFADLSPHARYLIPYHLNQLCSHLSSRRSDSFGHALMTEEAQLRERLIQMKNDS